MALDRALRGHCSDQRHHLRLDRAGRSRPRRNGERDSPGAIVRGGEIHNLTTAPVQHIYRHLPRPDHDIRGHPRVDRRRTSFQPTRVGSERSPPLPSASYSTGVGGLLQFVSSAHVIGQLFCSRSTGKYSCRLSNLHLLATCAVTLGRFAGVSKEFDELGAEFMPATPDGTPRTSVWQDYARRMRHPSTARNPGRDVARRAHAGYAARAPVGAGRGILSPSCATHRRSCLGALERAHAGDAWHSPHGPLGTERYRSIRDRIRAQPIRNLLPALHAQLETGAALLVGRASRGTLAAAGARPRTAQQSHAGAASNLLFSHCLASVASLSPWNACSRPRQPRRAGRLAALI